MHALPSHSPKRKRRSGLTAWRRFAKDETGAAYTLSYVMVIPVYALLLCLIVETALMLTAKLGTVYAAYAAVRTASVWSAHTTWDKARDKARKAAVKSMTPFASGTQSGRFGTPPLPTLEAVTYIGAFHAFAKDGDSVSKSYLLTKFDYAKRHIRVELPKTPLPGTSEITAKVSYDFPFNVPGIGRLIGRRIDGNYYFTISSEATIPSEGPQNDRNTIGIGYGILE